MLSERTNKDAQSIRHTQGVNSKVSVENAHASLALLLGPETDYTMRVRANRRLAKYGPSLLPLVLTTLNNYPEIISPSWPWLPPQYEHLGRLLVHFCQRDQLSIEALLHYPTLSQPAGPVLWACIIEAASLLNPKEHEALFCQGLTTPWATVHFAAATALAALANKTALQPLTLAALRRHLHENTDIPTRITSSYALLQQGENCGLDVLLQYLEPFAPGEARTAVIFLLATEHSLRLSSAQRSRLTGHLLSALHDTNVDIALNAAHALSNFAPPSVLSTLRQMLASTNPSVQIAVLNAIEELAQRANMRRLLHHQTLPTHILPFLKADTAHVRRQACYTLASCGGEYVTAVLGTIALDQEHPGHIEAIESLRVLHGVMRPPTRTNVIRWLLFLLPQSSEAVQITILGSLTHLLRKARTLEQKQAWHTISQEILRDGTTVCLLHNAHARVRQGAIELSGMLDDQYLRSHELVAQLLYLLRTDTESTIRACVTSICGQLKARWAIPELLRTLLDPDPYVARTALTTLSKIATSDDVIVVYALKELALLPGTHDPLARKARSLLQH